MISHELPKKPDGKVFVPGNIRHLIIGCRLWNELSAEEVLEIAAGWEREVDKGNFSNPHAVINWARELLDPAVVLEEIENQLG